MLQYIHYIINPVREVGFEFTNYQVLQANTFNVQRLEA